VSVRGEFFRRDLDMQLLHDHADVLEEESCGGQCLIAIFRHDCEFTIRNGLQERGSEQRNQK
jgi:hypothetical protein